jgi:hypothetical protein
MKVTDPIAVFQGDEQPLSVRQETVWVPDKSQIQLSKNRFLVRPPMFRLQNEERLGIRCISLNAHLSLSVLVSVHLYCCSFRTRSDRQC